MHKRLQLSRRSFLKLGGGAIAAAAGARLLPGGIARLRERAALAAAANITPRYFLAGTDGWISMPADSAHTIPTYHPDAAAPSSLTTYVFGFANATSYLSNPAGAIALKNHAQAPAPMMYFDENQDYVLQLTNLGLQQRPDLFDAHTIHWHGFRNAIPMFDGEPTSSVSVPPGSTLQYFYRPREAGTYMYHCHVEDTEHVHMGMTGSLFVRPAQNGTSLGGFTKFAYNDGDGSTGYHREFIMFMSEIWAEQHWDDAHIQLPEWTDYRPDFCLLNGRVYPDTLLPNNAATNSDGNSLARQPMSALITANVNERVLLRFSNLGYTYQSMTLAGLKMKVVGKDATLLRGLDASGNRAGSDLSYYTNTISIGPGESVDAIFQAPSTPGTYLLYNRNYARLSNAGGPGFGGQMTEIRVGTGLPPQTEPNT